MRTSLSELGQTCPPPLGKDRPHLCSLKRPLVITVNPKEMASALGQPALWSCGCSPRGGGRGSASQGPQVPIHHLHTSSCPSSVPRPECHFKPMCVFEAEVSFFYAAYGWVFIFFFLHPSSPLMPFDWRIESMYI